MQVIAKRKMTFLRSEILEHPESKQKEHKIHETFTLQFKPTEVQVAPDWISEDGLFDLAVQDGNLIVVDGNNVIAVGGATTGVLGWGAGGKK